MNPVVEAVAAVPYWFWAFLVAFQLISLLVKAVTSDF